MSKRNTSKYTSLTKTQTFIKAHPEIIKDIDNFQIESDTLDSKIVNAETALKLINQTPDVTPADVKRYKINMSIQVFALVKLARSVCVQTDNTELLNSLTFYSDHISRADKIISVVRARGIVAFIALKKGIFTNIRSEDYLIANKAISTYDTMKDVPAMTKKNKQSFGTAMYKKALNEGRACIKNMQQMIEAKYTLSNFTLVKAFRILVRIYIPGIRHNPVYITLIDAVTGLPVKLGTIQKTTSKGKIKTYKASAKGIVQFKSLKLGTATYIAIIPGYDDKSFNVTPIKGKKLNIIIKLNKS